MLKTYYHHLNEKDYVVSSEYAPDVPEDFISSDDHRKQFDRAIGLIADDLVQNFINQKSAFDKRQCEGSTFDSWRRNQAAIV